MIYVRASVVTPVEVWIQTEPERPSWCGRKVVVSSDRIGKSIPCAEALTARQHRPGHNLKRLHRALVVCDVVVTNVERCADPAALCALSSAPRTANAAAMSTRRNKRRRIDTDLDSIASEQPHSPLRKQLAPEREPDDLDSVSPEEAPAEELNVEAFAKEREIWDAFREEHYERTYSSTPYCPPFSATLPPQSSNSCPSPSIAPLPSSRSSTNRPKVRLLLFSVLPHLTRCRALVQLDTRHSQICLPPKSLGRHYRQAGPCGLRRER